MNTGTPPIAIVTGASSGIGIEFARLLADMEYHVLLVGRSETRLREVQTKLLDSHPHKISIQSIDLNAAGSPVAILEKAQGMGHPRVLINNAGTGKIGDFLEQDEEVIRSMIQTNLVSLTEMCHLFGKEMSRNGGGFILNHSSFSAIQPPSNYAVYAATKSYVLTLSQAIRRDLKTSDVKVSALCSGFFDSDFVQKIGQPPGVLLNLMTLNKAKIAQIGIRCLLRGKTIVIPGWRYRIWNLMLRLLPRSWGTHIADFIVGDPEKGDPEDKTD